MSLREACIWTRDRRSNIGPNQGYFKQLGEAEQALFNLASPSITMFDYYLDCLLQYGKFGSLVLTR